MQNGIEYRENILQELFSAFGSEYRVAKAFGDIVVACVYADGEITERECKFADDLLGLGTDPEKIKKMVEKTGFDSAVKNVGNLFRFLSEDAKSELLLLCILFLVVDEELSGGEFLFLKKTFMNMCKW